jgi:hypothetical protein
MAYWCCSLIYLVLNDLVIEVTLFCYSVQFTDINSCTVSAVHAPPNTYHVIFPEISLALHCTD